METPDLKRKASPTGSPLATPLLDDGFTKVEKRKKKRLDKHRPQFQYDTSYFRTGKKIGIAHIRDLSLFIAADAQKPSWIVVDNPSYVSHTVVVLATGLLPSHLGLPTMSPAASLPFLTRPPALAPGELPAAQVPTIPKLFMYGCPVRAPGDQRKLHSVMGTLLQSPLPEYLKRKRDANAKRASEISKENATPALYLCTPNQMSANGYRLPSYVEASDDVYIPGELPPDVKASLASRPQTVDARDFSTTGVALGGPRPVIVDEQGRRRRGNVRGEEGWVETAEAEGPPPDGTYPVLAIDCEMCLSEDGQELARVSIVDLDGKVVFDELVTPPKPVTDHLTQYSGITAERLATATHTLETVQEALVTGPNPVITPHTILLGHSLDCDLAALKIRHPLVIDTTVIFRHARGPPYKPGLKWLAQRWLGKSIQADAGGHDSEEDARTCVDLLKMKLAHGPDFGDPSVDTESIFARLSRYSPTPKGPKRTSLVADYGNPRSWFGASATDVVPCTTDDEVTDAVVSGVAKHDYTFARLTELSQVQHWNSQNGDNNATDAAEEDVEAALKRFDERLGRIHAALPDNSALILLTGHSDPRPMLQLAARRQQWEKSYREKGPEGSHDVQWTTEDDRALEVEVGKTREGMGFFCVKKLSS